MEATTLKIKEEPSNEAASSACQGRKRKVTFVDLTLDDSDDEDEVIKSNSSARAALKEKTHEHNLRSSAVFTLDYGSDKPVTQVSNDSRKQKQASPQPVLSSALFSPSANSATSTSSKVRSTAVRTSAITLLDSRHGEQRRKERNISRREIQAAMKHGTKRPHADPNKVIYEYRGQKHIISKNDKRLVTTMDTSFSLTYRPVSQTEMRKHESDLQLIHRSVEEWNSHTVLVVDKSGSMRNSDVSGCRSRFSAVWLSIAQDFIGYRLDTQMASSTDVVSVVLMGESAKLLIDRFPTDKILFNIVVDLFRNAEQAARDYSCRVQVPKKIVHPHGHGHYLPALEMSKRHLKRYDNRSSPLQLLLLSDGRPSDSTIIKGFKEETLSDPIQSLASEYGRRFDFSAIGMGNMKDFECLKNLVSVCDEFSSRANLQLPGMSCAELEKTFRTFATSTFAYHTEVIDDIRRNPRKKAKRVRSCIRESSRKLPALTEVVNEDDFKIFMGRNVERCFYENAESATDEFGRQKKLSSSEKKKKVFIPTTLQHPDAKGVAFKKKAFGEGTERFAHQFFEIAEDGITVVGNAFVAKESRFVEDIDCDKVDWKERDRFVKRFCKIQSHCEEVANAFNSKLDSISILDPDTTRVSFVDCHVYYLSDATRGQYAVLVEPLLNGKFQKWNNNNGWKKQSHSDIGGRSVYTLDDEDESDEGISSTKEILTVTENEVSQAFSHFSHHWTHKNSVICDLQGVFCQATNTLKFTDPVVHHFNSRKDNKEVKYGKTDLGQRGIDSFFSSHRCNKLCELVTRGFKSI